MTASLTLLLAISILFVIGIGAAFWWAIFSGQFDDAHEAALRVLEDDDTSDALQHLDTKHEANASEKPDKLSDKRK